MGPESENIILQFPNTANTFQETLVGFDHYFFPKKNVVFERARFNRRRQQPGEPVESFITDLHVLSEHCEFVCTCGSTTMKNDFIRDRIVDGILDQNLSDRLQLKSNLKLEDAILEAKQAEMLSWQSNILRNGEGMGKEVCALDKRKYRSSKGSSGKTAGWAQNKEVAGSDFCGKESHSREKCPARKATCSHSKKIGHWAKVCKNKSVRAVEKESEESNSEEENNNKDGFIGLMARN
ncbi:uncharacterized protein LOC132704835 isoform X3 [Cylas formicarius]|uniref:uncharacterized protein LOC132704835 isoform X3 n=1 Tax=Cylas formicarius TaxID=197179 RepID=UPI0029584516|nr:uncharacterized protein LOC132704835 isoform X3 [Cylas formicarius]